MASPLTLLMIYSAAAVLGLVGVWGNVVSLVIWTRPCMKSSSSVPLVAIAVGDLLTDLLFITRALLSTVIYYSPTDPNNRCPFYASFRAWATAVYFVVQTASTYLTLAISLERYVAVCHPFNFRQICTHSRARKYTWAIVIVSFIYNLPRFLFSKVAAQKDYNGKTYYEVVFTELFINSSIFQTIYTLHDTWLRIFFIYLLPLSCISVLNVLIYLEVKKSEKLRMRLSTSEREENNTTKMLVYVVLEFSVCSSVGMLHAILEILDISKEQLWLEWSKIVILNDFLTVFNSSSNFFTYAIFGSRFRKCFFTTFSGCLKICRLKLPSRMADRALGLRIPTAPAIRPSDCNQNAEVHV